MKPRQVSHEDRLAIRKATNSVDGTTTLPEKKAAADAVAAVLAAYDYDPERDELCLSSGEIRAKKVVAA